MKELVISVISPKFLKNHYFSHAGSRHENGLWTRLCDFFHWKRVKSWFLSFSCCNYRIWSLLIILSVYQYISDHYHYSIQRSLCKTTPCFNVMSFPPMISEFHWFKCEVISDKAWLAIKKTQPLSHWSLSYQRVINRSLTSSFSGEICCLSRKKGRHVMKSYAEKKESTSD